MNADDLLARMRSTIDTHSIERQLQKYRDTGVKIEAVHLHPDDIQELIARMQARGYRPDPYKPLTWNRIPIVSDPLAPKLPRLPCLPAS